MWRRPLARRSILAGGPSLSYSGYFLGDGIRAQYPSLRGELLLGRAAKNVMGYGTLGLGMGSLLFHVARWDPPRSAMLVLHPTIGAGIEGMVGPRLSLGARTRSGWAVGLSEGHSIGALTLDAQLTFGVHW